MNKLNKIKIDIANKLAQVKNINLELHDLQYELKKEIENIPQHHERVKECKLNDEINRLSGMLKFIDTPEFV